jgi:hypothetical protein
MRNAGFPGAKGSADATLFPLSSKPGVNGYAYFSRKKTYSVFGISIL